MKSNRMFDEGCLTFCTILVMSVVIIAHPILYQVSVDSLKDIRLSPFTKGTAIYFILISVALLDYLVIISIVDTYKALKKAKGSTAVRENDRPLTREEFDKIPKHEWLKRFNTLSVPCPPCFERLDESEDERDKAESELLSFCDGLDIKQGRTYYICYDPRDDSFECDSNGDMEMYDYLLRKDDVYYYVNSPYRFANNESCENAINILGKEKLKLIFRIN